MGIIYKIINTQNQKIYVGQTTGSLENRWYHHVYDALYGIKKTKLCRAIRKYGEFSFKIETIETTDKLNEREIYFIQFFNSIKNGYNIKIGGNGGPHAESTKKKIAKANKKRIWTKEMRETMSKSIKIWHKERGFVPRSEEFKAKISIANSKRKMSKKTQEKFQEYNNLRKRPIFCLTNETEYDSINSASNDLKINDGQLRQHLKGKYKHVKGFIFKYK